jgi:phospholipid transport system substrate-binding protein
MKTITKIFCVLATVFLLAAPQANAADTPTEPKDIIAKFNDTLLSVMKRANSLGYHGRYRTLDPVLSNSFDFPFMIRYAVGQSWKTFSDEQKQDLAKAFSDFTIATYADRFNGYSGETFAITDSRNSPRDTHLVMTELTKKDGEKVKLNYLMHQTEKGWRIIDIFLKGSISELATKRSEYASTIKKSGYLGLVSSIKAKIAILQAQRPTSQ